MSYYLKLEPAEPMRLKRALERDLYRVAENGEADFAITLELLKKLMIESKSFRDSEKIDEKVRSTKLMQALADGGYFDYEEDLDELDFEGLVDFLEDGDEDMWEALKPAFNGDIKGYGQVQVIS